jgi:ubiquinone/menaquinone biosynthesis C-methylase UbiE
MSWKDLINSQNFSWHLNTEGVENPTPYLLHSCIFTSTEEQFNDYLRYVENLLKIQNGESLAEFGCGNGANLFYFKQKYRSEVYGCDISAPLVDFCNRFFGKGFTVGSEITLPDKSVDHFISNSVFQYLDSYETAQNVIKEMCRVAKKSVLITDIKDIAFREKFRLNQSRRQGITIEELDEKYKNTPHLFYDRTMFATTVDMPITYPDAEFGSFSSIIRLDT